jgi:hypothetical protein
MKEEKKGEKKLKANKHKTEPLMIEFNKRRDDIVSHLKVTFCQCRKMS